MNRDQLANQFHVSTRMLADAVFVVRNAPQDIIDRVEAGTLTVQAAMRMLGKTTQRDRYRRRTALVTDLCTAVLDGEYSEAKRIALELTTPRAKTTGLADESGEGQRDGAGKNMSQPFVANHQESEQKR